MTKTLGAIAAIIMAHACASPSTSEVARMLRLQTDTTHYVPAATVAITLLNVSSSPLGYNVCAVLEHLRSAAWVVVPPQDDAVPCDLVVHPLAPGEEAVARHTLPLGTLPGPTGTGSIGSRANRASNSHQAIASATRSTFHIRAQPVTGDEHRETGQG